MKKKSWPSSYCNSSNGHWVLNTTHWWSLLLVHLPAPLWKLLIVLLGMLHVVYGTSSPMISASLVKHSLLHFLLSHMAVHHLHHLHYHRLHHLLLAQNFILNLKLGSSANPFLHRPFLSYWTDYMDYRTIYDFTLLNGSTGKYVRLSRLLAFECTLNHCTFIHSSHMWTIYLVLITSQK